jgi:hypothetical protein
MDRHDAGALGGLCVDSRRGDGLLDFGFRHHVLFRSGDCGVVFGLRDHSLPRLCLNLGDDFGVIIPQGFNCEIFSAHKSSK